MKKSKLFAMMLIPAAFAACTNEDILEGPAVNGALNGDVVKDVLFGISMSADASETRGQYAGYDKVGDEKNHKIFTNFYLEPKFDGAGKVVLSNHEEFAGDMFGFCLSDGSKALTNLPFYIAGYGSKKATTDNAKTLIFPFVAHTDNVSANALYNLPFSAETYTVGPNAMTKADYDESVGKISDVTSTTDLDADVLDVRKAIVRNNAGVMSGQYIAYYPYNADFYTQGGIPVNLINEGKALRTDVALQTSQKAAMTEADFYGNLFAVSASPVTVDGKTKTGDIKLTPRTGAIFFKIFDATKTGETNKNAAVKIKRIVVQAQENAAETDFIHEGSVPMDNLMAINGTKSTSMVGVQFDAATFTGTAEADAKWAMTYCYPNLQNKPVQLKVYDNEGRVAVVQKTAIPEMGASVTYTVKVNELNFAATEREIFTTADFDAEVGTEGTLILMDNITSTATLGKKLTIKGGKKLTLKGAINAELTMEGSELELNNATISANITSNGKVTLSGYAGTVIDKKISATTLENKANVTLRNAAVTTLENNGTLAVKYLKDASVVVGTLNNHNALTVENSAVNDQTSLLTVTTLNNTVTMSATPTVTVNAKNGTQTATLAATTITNNGTTKYPNNNSGILYTPEITIKGKTNASNVTNKGTLQWASAEAMNYSVTNSGTFNITENCSATGTVTNNSNLNINSTVAITAGGITTNGTTNVNGNLIASGAKFTVTAGTVNCHGTVNGSANIEVKGGEFIKYVTDKANLQAAIATTGVAERYNAICVNDVITADFAFETQKKVYINANLTTTKAVAFKDVVTRGTVTYTATGNATMNSLTIQSGTLTLNGGVINIANKFTNYGTFAAGSNAVVNCKEIAGWGNWGMYPNF